MAWIGAAIGAVGGLLSSSGDKNGGAGAQQSSNRPWDNAQPLLVQQLNQAYGLGDKYAREPFNARQTAAMENQYGLSDYGRELVPSLLGQLSGQPVGYDPKNPTARPKAWDFNQLALMKNLQSTKNPIALPTPAPVAAPEPVRGQFTQQTGNDMDFGRAALMRNFGNPEGTTQGGYGSYRYGDPITAANETDARLYAALGGYDPRNILNGLRPNAGMGALALMGGFGGPSTGVDGIGVAGSDAAVGSSANF